MGFCAYGVAVVVGCCYGGEVGFCRGCGGEVEGVGLWIGVVEVWVCGSAWWRPKFLDRCSGGRGKSAWWRSNLALC